LESKTNRYLSIAYAVLAAALFGMSAPFSKLLLSEVPPLMMSSLVYLGAGLGMLIADFVKSMTKSKKIEARLEKKELPYILAMIALDIAAPISLMLGLTMTTAANAALLSNFEIVATSVIALVIFKEAVGKRLWLSIALITIASVILSTDDIRSLSFSAGSILVLLSCVFWGLENNCTRKLSIKDPLQVVIIKGLGSGTGALIIAVYANELVWNIAFIAPALLLGFFAYGLSIFFYVTAQRTLGAARTSAYYAVAPFIGVLLSFFLFDEPITIAFAVASLIMVAGTYFAVAEKHEHPHTHHEFEHEHRHSHSDGHHNHFHEESISKEHSHLHTHEEILHAHGHTPDIHHLHQH
jgi:drug/metabolite transporter (DMT)-like permease